MKHHVLFIILFSCLLFIACKEQAKTEEKQSEPTTTDYGANGITGTSGINGTYVIDPQSSEVKWKGIKPTGIHNGIVPVMGGAVNVMDGIIVAGKVAIDMTGITVLDLEGARKEKLEGHLRGKDPGREEDFFNVDKFPRSTYVINSVSALNNDPDGTHMINGTLTIKDISKPVNFKAKVNIADGKLSAVTPEFSVDRTEYDIRFKSRKFFTNLQDDFINDEFKLQISVIANKQ